MTPTPLRFWTRYCVMDDFDDAMLSFALRDAFPNVLFIHGGTMRKMAELNPAATIPECDQTVVDIWFPHDNWKPLFFPHPDYPNRFDCINPPHLFLRYVRTRWDFGGSHADRKWAFDYPTPERGRISSGRWEWDEEQRELRSKVTKILGRLSNNRLKSLLDRDRFLSKKDAKRGNLWVGYHVLDWCSEDPRRAIDGHSRPCDDWEHKETAWYRYLKKRVVDRFGENYGGPRKFVPTGKRSYVPYRIPI